MPEYLAPGVYVEEVSFRSKSIEGVPTSTTGFAGMTRYGPVRYPAARARREPRLITSFTEFERVYGGLDRCCSTAATSGRAYLAHAARAFFINGGQRLYVSRVFARAPAADDDGVARQHLVAVGGDHRDLDGALARRRRQRGGDRRAVVRSKNVAYPRIRPSASGARAQHGAVVEIDPAAPPAGGRAAAGTADPALDPATLAVVTIDADGRQTFIRRHRPSGPTPTADPAGRDARHRRASRRSASTSTTSSARIRRQKRDIAKILERDDPEDEDAVVWLDWTPIAGEAGGAVALLLVALQAHPAAAARRRQRRQAAQPDDLRRRGRRPRRRDEEGDRSRRRSARSTTSRSSRCPTAARTTTRRPASPRRAADRARRDGCATASRSSTAPQGSSMTEIRDFRGQFDSKYARALPPVDRDPRPAAARQRRARRRSGSLLPPSGFVAGIYARTDIERGVYKAPANEVVPRPDALRGQHQQGAPGRAQPRGHQRAALLRGPRQPRLGRAHDELGPRVEVRQRAAAVHLPRALDRQGHAVGGVRAEQRARSGRTSARPIEDFLLVQWQRRRAARATSPSEAYFVRCDRTTMTQNDLDNGRLICLIGVAPDASRPSSSSSASASGPPTRSWSDARRARWPTFRDNPYGAFNFLVVARRRAGRRRRGHDRRRLLRRLRPRHRGQLLRVPQRQRDVQHRRARCPNTHKATTSRSSAGWSARPTCSSGSRACATAPPTARTVTITLLDEARNPVAAWRLRNAQPKKWTGPTLAAKGGGEVAMEELHLVHEGHRVRVSATLTASASRSARPASTAAARRPPRALTGVRMDVARVRRRGAARAGARAGGRRRRGRRGRALAPVRPRSRSVAGRGRELGRLRAALRRLRRRRACCRTRSRRSSRTAAGARRSCAIVHDYARRRRRRGVASAPLQAASARPSRCSARNEGVWGNGLRATLRVHHAPARVARRERRRGAAACPRRASGPGSLLRATLRRRRVARVGRSASARRAPTATARDRVAALDAAMPAAAGARRARRGHARRRRRRRPRRALRRARRSRRAPALARARAVRRVARCSGPAAAWARRELLPPDRPRGQPHRRSWTGGADRLRADIVPDDFFDPRWVLGDESPRHAACTRSSGSPRSRSSASPTSTRRCRCAGLDRRRRPPRSPAPTSRRASSRRSGAGPRRARRPRRAARSTRATRPTWRRSSRLQRDARPRSPSCSPS